MKVKETEAKPRPIAKDHGVGGEPEFWCRERVQSEPRLLCHPEKTSLVARAFPRQVSHKGRNSAKASRYVFALFVPFCGHGFGLGVKPFAP
jgi:hypothetical protein